MKNRCKWCGKDPLYIAYHDDEWGMPVHDDRRLFEFLILEGAQAGLSWLTILKKRENYRKAFHNFDYDRIADYSETDVRRLLADSGIVRNRLKIGSAIKNARGVIDIRMNLVHWMPISGAMFRASQSKTNGNPWQNFR
jgi:DNA-3-methyladenine glycosylase I